MKLLCPDCGGEMSSQGYRQLYPTCTNCGKSFHVDDCVRED